MIRPIFLTVILTLGAMPAVAGTDVSTRPSGNPSAAENTGFFGGVAVGASVGGPPGAMVGGAIGALLGNGWHARKQVGEMQNHVADLRRQAEVLQQEKAALELALRDAVRQRNQTIPANYSVNHPSNHPADHPAGYEEPLSGCCDNTVVSVYFRSGADSVETHDHEVLASFARLSNHMADPLVEITGYADRNGDAESNLKLSQRRSLQVRNLLAQMGVDNTRITTVAYGETRPLSNEPTFETDFFDRRVILRLRDASQLMLSSSPEPIQ